MQAIDTVVCLGHWSQFVTWTLDQWHDRTLNERLVLQRQVNSWTNKELVGRSIDLLLIDFVSPQFDKDLDNLSGAGWGAGERLDIHAVRLRFDQEKKRPLSRNQT